MPLYPLKFEPIYKDKVWGGRALERLGKQLPEGQKIGESWELADLSATSASGGGGNPERSLIANGPLKGKTLHEAMDQFGDEMMGQLPHSEQGNFPLLVKFLDARENLSVQVHPDQRYVKNHPDTYLKSEAWYILDAEQGAVIYKGIREGVTPEQFRQAIEDNTVEDLLIQVPARIGECHYLPSGTCHALGAGIVVAEVQTPSDTTFRVYDWGREGRELHIDQAMETIHFHPPDTETYEQRTHIGGLHTTVSRLVQCEYFRIERVRMSEGYAQEIPYNQPAIWMVLQGRGRVTCRNAGQDETTFHRGETLLIPARMEDAHIHLDEDTVWLEVTFPQAMSSIIA